MAASTSSATLTSSVATEYSTDLHDDGPDGFVYTAPAIIDLGNVRDVTKGSSGSGKADANSQYYWA